MTRVADPVERPEECSEVDVAVSRRATPAAALVAEVEVRREDRAPSVEAADGVLDVYVVDAVGELQSEGGRVEELVCEMGRIEIDPERGTTVDRLERLAGRYEVVSDLGRVHFSRPNRTPSCSKTSKIGPQRSAKS